MPSVRLSSEAVKVFKQANSKSKTRGFNPIVSIIHDDEDSDTESESDETNAVVLTPRMKEHAKRIYGLHGNDIGGHNVLSAPVSNLSKRFSSSSIGTPSRILQLASVKGTSSESNSHLERSKENISIDLDTEDHSKYSRNEAEKQTSPLEASKERHIVGTKYIQEDQQRKASNKKETHFKSPLTHFKIPLTSRRRWIDTPELAVKTSKKRGKNKKVEEVDDVSEETASSDVSGFRVSARRDTRSRKKQDANKTPTAPVCFPPKLVNVNKVIQENISTVSVTRDDSLLSNDLKNSSSVDDTINFVIDCVVGNNGSPEKVTNNSRKRKNVQEKAEDSEDDVGTVTVRRGTKKGRGANKTAKRIVGNRKPNRIAQEVEDSAVLREKPNVLDEENVDTSSTNVKVPQFSSDHEDDRSPMSSPSKDSPIITKSNRLSRLSQALIIKSPGHVDSSYKHSPPRSRRLLSTPSRSPSASPDMFTEGPSGEELVKNTKALSPKTKPNMSRENGDYPKTRSRIRSSIGADSTLPVGTTPLQLEAVGLLRKPTPQSVPCTPPRGSVAQSVTTPFSSRRNTIQDMIVESRSASRKAVKEMQSSLKRKQQSHMSVTTQKRQRTRSLSPQKTRKCVNVEEQNTSETRPQGKVASPQKLPENLSAISTPKTPLTRLQAQHLSPDKTQEPLIRKAPNTPRCLQQGKDFSSQKLSERTVGSTSTAMLTRQRARSASPVKFQGAIIANNVEALPRTTNVRKIVTGSLEVSAFPSTSPSGQQSTLPRSEGSAVEQNIANGTNLNEDSSLLFASSMQPARFNPYLAQSNDPIRATQLMANEHYRVSWLHILPKCSYYFRVRSPTTALMISGVILISSDGNQRGLVLNSSSKVADLETGSICQAVNTGETIAIFQLTEYNA